MSNERKLEVLHIKKYPNRRFYDATRSRHVTLQEVHDLIMQGHDIVVTDSRNAEDITNVILLQILLEKDHPKLDLFPTWILHQFLRSNRQVLRTSVERFFGPFMNIFVQSQKQFDTYVREAMRGNMLSPMDWANSMMRAWSSGGAPQNQAPSGMESDNGYPEPPGYEPNPEAETLDQLRAQVAELTSRIESLSREHQPEAGRKG